MERPYVGWEEVVISNERGKRQVNYYLRRSDGKGLDLAVVGKERTVRHMSYSFVLYKKGDAEPPIVVAPPPPNGRLKSRREVIDWLSFVVSDSSSPGPSQQVARLLEEDAFDACLPSSKDSYVRNLAPKCKEFLWVGHATTGRKRRKHYQSFCRNGITISVHDFVYVLAEENKRLVAYLEDLYEDSRSNKMVVVRWFHKVDEVGIILPPNFNDREIFFSLCLQDLSVECIDGLAAVLGPQHFEKYLNEATHTLWQPFLCHRQFDNDVITDFDITQVQGYWTQEILRYMYTASSPKPMEHNLFIDTMADVPVNDDDDVEDGVMRRPLKKKKHSRSKSKELLQESNDHKGVHSTDDDLSKLCNGLVSESGTENCGVKKSNFAIPLSMKEMEIDTPKMHLAKDCPVEVLSQDSGIKGCWFRAVVIKRSKEKVKVRYLDLKDVEDDTKHVEEWIWANRIAVPDGLGIRLHGRVTVRPTPSSSNGISAEYMDAGSPVDAWWHDGWWEGIVVRVDSDNKFHVYFPGEKKMSIFDCDNLRCSQDWLCDRWCSVKCRPDLASLFLSGNETVQDKSLDVEGIHLNPLASSKTLDGEGIHSIPLASSKRQYVRNHSVVYVSPKEQPNSPCLELNNDTTKGMNSLPNLAKDNLLAQLRWNSSKKRRRCRGRSQRRGSSCLKQQSDGSGSSSSSREDVELSPDSHLPNSSKFDSKGFKYQQDSLHDVSIPLIAGLVLSR